MIETQRLRLRRLTLSDTDAAFMIRLVNDPGWIANIGDRGVRDEDQARAYIADRFTPNFWMKVCDAATGEPLGLCGIVPTREGLDYPDLGYAFLARHSGKGYATEAASIVLAHALGPLGHPRLAAITSLDNTPSQRVLEKIGFRPLGVRNLPGHADDSAYFETA